MPIATKIFGKYVEQDPQEWWLKCCKVLRAALKDPATRKKIKLITVTTSASCLVCVDKNGDPLMNSILVSDGRSIKQANELNNTYEFQEIKNKLGLKATPDLMLPKILWLRDQLKHIFRKTNKFLSPADFLIQKLTGRYVIDVNNAIKFHYDIFAKRYPERLYEYLKIDLKKLPDVVEVGSYVGNLIPQIASKFGLAKDVKIIAATYDALCSVFGSGLSKIGEGCDVSGTVTSVRVVTDKHVASVENRVYFSPYFRDERWLAGGSNNLGGGIIEWVKQLFYIGNADPYRFIEAETKKVGPCPKGLIFLPYLLGERAPVWDPLARGVFFGLDRGHSHREFIKAVLESVGFSVLHIVSTLNDLGIDLKKVIVSGGLARLDSVSQIKADMLNVPVEKLEEFETTSIGAAILAGVGVGLYKDIGTAARKYLKVSKRFYPNKKRNAIYRDYFEIYKNLYGKLRDLFVEKEKLAEKHSEILETKALLKNL